MRSDPASHRDALSAVAWLEALGFVVLQRHSDGDSISPARIGREGIIVMLATDESSFQRDHHCVMRLCRPAARGRLWLSLPRDLGTDG